VGTTTIRLEKALRGRVRSAARRTGTNPHSFMVAAIEEKTRQAEQQQEFRDVAAARLRDISQSGRTIPWAQMRSYLQKRASGHAASAPKARKLPKT
jgi:predicted transcriptional regulator